MTTTAYRGHEEFFLDPQRCIGCHACEMACAECETNGQLAMIHADYVDRAESPQTAVQSACTARNRPAPASAPPTRSRRTSPRRRPLGERRPLHRLQQLRPRLPLRRPEEGRVDEADDEVQPLLRPDERGAKAHVRHGLPEWRPLLRDARADGRDAAEQLARERVPVRPAARADARERDDAEGFDRARRRRNGGAMSDRPDGLPDRPAWRSTSPRARRGAARLAARVREVPRPRVRRPRRRERLGRREGRPPPAAIPSARSASRRSPRSRSAG